MAANSKYSKTLYRQLWVFRIIDWVCLFLPTIIYVFIALFDSGVVVYGKVAVSASVIMALIFTLINIVTKKKISCVIWILMVGLIVALHDLVLPLVIIMAITSALHDFLLQPLVETYKTAYISSRTDDDKREFEKLNP